MNKREVWDEMIETDEIMGIIRQEGAEYFSKEGKYKIEVGIYLEQLMEERGITRKTMVNRLNLEESYGRKLFGGQRIPTRKILLQCAFLLALDLKETQRLLEVGQDQINAFLEEIGEENIEKMSKRKAGHLHLIRV